MICTYESDRAEQLANGSGCGSIRVPLRRSELMQYTTDRIWSESIRIVQSKRGYRFGIDAVLLAHFLKASAGDDVLEIGCGNGVIAILLSHLQSFKKLVAVEVQKDPANLASQNFHLNQVNNAEVLQADIRELETSDKFDLIYSNPPYRKIGAGKLNPSPEKAVARHEIKLKLEDLFFCAKKFLKPDGRLSLILPQFREEDLLRLARGHHLPLRERREVHSFRDERYAFLLVTLSETGGTLLEHPPLIIYDAPGRYSSEMQSLLTR